jgi:hypothetical protein
MTLCVSCENEVATKSKRCRHCGHESTTMKSSTLALSSGFVFVITFLAYRKYGATGWGEGELVFSVLFVSGWICIKSFRHWRKFT